MRERMVSHLLHIGAAVAEKPVLNLLNEFRTFFQNRLVGGAVAVIDLEAESFEGIAHLFRRQFAGLAAEFFGDGHADGGRRMADADAALVGELLFHLFNKAHLFDSVERAGDQALTAIQAGVFTDVVLGAETAVNGVDRAELGARVATDATVLIDMDNAAEFALAEITLVSRSVFPVGTGTREEV